ncbi:AraC family transcriptional regulator [Salipaludibacillus sp. LMS25]|jgi:AraC family transcriptional regulator of arabinose operon|uniref:AraC family transcriptional regulator n=1 Tax=Salipaludibacillus sp. LMS25 TaxID=2924031 RepID=UPI0020D0E05C|nr:AraC family transcriptional regulator [Salipaludibacillus sp. LMS25]UTR13757.1 AraC family transcriptional regulator [Salipaludibacillus sp. LMS25]
MERDYVLKTPERDFSEFNLLFCGYAECDPLHHFGPAVRANYIIHIVLAGQGYYRVGDKMYQLKAGQGFLIEPNVLTHYQADGEDPWHYVWIGFNGHAAKNHLHQIGLGGKKVTFETSQADALKTLVFNMLKCDNPTIAKEYYLQSQLYLYFAKLAETTALLDHAQQTKDNHYVEKAVQFIQTHYEHPIKVTDIAQYVSLNRSYLSSMFQKNTGKTIQQCLTEFRMIRAEELLTLTHLSITQIAESCGYRDPLIFSKAFKKINGCTPSQYRNQAPKRITD